MAERTPERRKSKRRSSKKRRSGKDRRTTQRRKKAPNPKESTRSGSDRRGGRRRSGRERRTRADRRGATVASKPDLPEGHRRRARDVPDKVLAASGTATERVIKVVRQTWKVAPMPVRAGIAEDLIPVLEPLVNQGKPVTEDVRLRCEEVVARWVGKKQR